MVTDTTILETGRLRLRPLVMDDLDVLAELYADPDVRRYFPDKTRTYDETREELEWIINEYYGKYGYGLWATILKQTGELIGRCGLIPWRLDGRLEVEVAYLLGKHHWGRGLATEAALVIRDYAFHSLGLERLICLIEPENAASMRVASKIGMHFERLLDPVNDPALVYAMSRPG
jgi:ribosomal-protein-alanine N-acetyltransferase